MPHPEGRRPVPNGNPVMTQFRILEHTADVGFEAFGATREGMFANAGRALFYLITDLEAVETSDRVTLALEAQEATSLLVDWLSEILYLWDAEGWLFRDFEIHRLTDQSLSATAWGERFDRERHQMFRDARMPRPHVRPSVVHSVRGVARKTPLQSSAYTRTNEGQQFSPGGQISSPTCSSCLSSV